MKKKYVIIVAAGSGSRMKADLPKQFQNLIGKPILMHTIEKFAHSRSNPNIILVLNKSMEETWKNLCFKHNMEIPHKIVQGGVSRFQSVKNGLLEIARLETANLENVFIAVHDAARPLITCELIDKCYKYTEDTGATVLAVKSTNSVRYGTSNSNEAIDRENVWIIQTPQTFRGDIMFESFKQPESPCFTDDASVVEKLGYPIYLIEGDHKNIKITFPEDMEIAQLNLT